MKKNHKLKHAAVFLLMCGVLLPLLAQAQQKPPAVEMLSLVGAKPTLSQEFDTPITLRGGATFTDAAPEALNDSDFNWAAGYLWSAPLAGVPDPGWPMPKRNFPAWTSNGNTNDADPNGDLIKAMPEEQKPVRWSKHLLLTADKMPPDLVETMAKDHKEYMGGVINSFPYSQKYGVYAMRAKVPGGAGTWPAFWLIPVDKSWPPEIDIMEQVGMERTTYHSSVHTKENGKHEAKGANNDMKIDLNLDFHEYAVDWGPETIKWYFDGKLVDTQKTPKDLHKPCYIIANISVSNKDGWGGAPDATTKFPATMEVDYIRAWQRTEYEENSSKIDKVDD